MEIAVKGREKSTSADYPSKEKKKKNHQQNRRTTKSRSKSRWRHEKSSIEWNSNSSKLSDVEASSTTAASPSINTNEKYGDYRDKKERQRRQRSDALKWERRDYST